MIFEIQRFPSFNSLKHYAVQLLKKPIIRKVRLIISHFSKEPKLKYSEPETNEKLKNLGAAHESDCSQGTGTGLSAARPCIEFSQKFMERLLK